MEKIADYLWLVVISFAYFSPGKIYELISNKHKVVSLLTFNFRPSYLKLYNCNNVAKVWKKDI